MAIELDDGTIVRSLPEQVDYLTTANENNEIAIDNLTARLEAAIAGVLHYKGSVPTYADLPADAEIGDVYNVIDTGANYAWTGSEWDELGMTVDLSNYVTLDGAQTISGVKNFANGLQIDGGNFVINETSSGYRLFRTGAYSESLTFTTGGLRIDALEGKSLYPGTTNYLDLGTSSFKWRNFYLVGELNLGGSKIEYDSGDSLLRSYSTFSPAIDNAYDLGDSFAKWRNIYLSGSLRDGNNANYGYKLPDSTSLTANSELLATNNPQTISSIKTFDTALGGNIKVVLNGVEKFAIYPDGNTYNTKLNAQGGTRIRFDTNQINFYNNITPLTSGNLDIGATAVKWRDLYLSRNLTDGTNSVTIADLKALIDYAKSQGWIS